MITSSSSSSVATTISKQIRRPLLTINSQLLRYRPQKEKVVVVMGATGAGKSRLSIDLATSLTAAEVINSDKMQVYKGLDITTNKITDEERCGVPHHLLDIVIDPDSDFSAANFRSMASLSLNSILGRRKLPIIVGGSNSFVEALIDSHNFQSRYDCCFLWVDVAMPVLQSFVDDRVDRMVDRGMVEEVRAFYSPNADYSKGIRRAIGVPELDPFFRVGSFCDDRTRARILAEGIGEVKRNTIKLARRQLEKIRRLRNEKGWKLHRLDATEEFRRRGGGAWEELVAGPGIEIMRRFLYDYEPVVKGRAWAEAEAHPLMVTAAAR